MFPLKFKAHILTLLKQTGDIKENHVVATQWVFPGLG